MKIIDTNRNNIYLPNTEFNNNRSNVEHFPHGSMTLLSNDVSEGDQENLPRSIVEKNNTNAITDTSKLSEQNNILSNHFNDNKKPYMQNTKVNARKPRDNEIGTQLETIILSDGRLVTESICEVKPDHVILEKLGTLIDSVSGKTARNSWTVESQYFHKKYKKDPNELTYDFMIVGGKPSEVECSVIDQKLLDKLNDLAGKGAGSSSAEINASFGETQRIWRNGLIKKDGEKGFYGISENDTKLDYKEII